MSQLSKADLHIHTIHSDGTATVPELLEYVAARTDLRLIAVTDHDSITGACQAARLAREFGVEVVIGEEVSTADGHLLALFVDTFLPPGRSAAETIAAIHAQGGLAIAPHPFDRSVPSLGRHGLNRPSWYLDGVEGFNASVIWSQRDSNRAAQRAAAELGLPLAHVEAILSLLAADEPFVLDEPFEVYLTCYRVLQASGDIRAANLLQRAEQRLRECAEQITDDALRRSFLEHVAAHHAILTAAHTTAPPVAVR